MEADNRERMLAQSRARYRELHPRQCAEPGCYIDVTGMKVRRCPPHAEAQAARIRARAKDQPFIVADVVEVGQCG